MTRISLPARHLTELNCRVTIADQTVFPHLRPNRGVFPLPRPIAQAHPPAFSRSIAKLSRDRQGAVSDSRSLIKLTTILLIALSSLAFAAPPKRPKAPTPPTAVRRWMKSLDINQKAAQLVLIAIYGDAPNVRSREYQQFVSLVRDTRVGGMILVNRVRNRVIKRAEPHALAYFLNRMQRLSKIPLLTAGDFERGASMRVDGTTLFPHAMAFAAAGDTDATRFAGQITAQESRALGIHWVLFPVADVNNNPDNPIINIRSFGEDPATVSAHVRAFIKGARSVLTTRVLTTAKHFPGHGDTSIDTHVNLASIPADRARLDSVELVPFRAAIEEGVDSIMTAHIAVPALEAPDIPATLSPAILTRLLREDMKFAGLISTDALDMGGVAKGFAVGEAAVRAIEAGADVLLMPSDPKAAVRALVAAVKTGRITPKRLDESVARILAAKQRLGLDRARLVDVEQIADAIDEPAAAERAQQIANHAVTMLRNERVILPLRAGDGSCLVILTESRQGIQGQAFTEEIRRQDSAAKVILLDPTVSESDIDDAITQSAACPKVAVAAFASIAAYRNGLSLPGSYPRLIETLAASDRPVALVALGNPYLIRNFPKVAAYLTTYSPVVPSEIAAAKALYGRIPTRGRLPVTIPDIAPRGAGIELPSQ